MESLKEFICEFTINRPVKAKKHKKGVDLTIKRSKDIVYVTTEQKETIELLSKPYKDPASDGSWLDTNYKPLDINIKETIQYNELEALLVNYTRE